eukprot:g300.t1
MTLFEEKDSSVLSIGHVDSAYGMSRDFGDRRSCATDPSTVFMKLRNGSRLKSARVMRRCLVTSMRDWNFAKVAAAEKFMSQLPFVWPSSIHLEQGHDRNSFRASMPLVSPSRLANIEGCIQSLRSVISLPRDENELKSAGRLRWSVKVDRLGIAGIRIGLCTVDAELRAPIGTSPLALRTSQDDDDTFLANDAQSKSAAHETRGRKAQRSSAWSFALCSEGVCLAGGARVDIKRNRSRRIGVVKSGIVKNLSSIREIEDQSGAFTSNSRIALQYDIGPNGDPRLIIEVNGRRLGRAVSLRSLWKSDDCRSGDAYRDSNIGRGPSLPSIDDVTTFTKEYRPWVCVQLDSIYALEAVHLLFGSDMPDRVRIEVSNAESPDVDAWIVAAEIDLRSFRGGDTSAGAMKWIKTELKNGTAGKLVRVCPIMHRRLVGGYTSARLLLFEVYAITKVDPDMLLSSDQSMSSAVTPLVTPSVKMLDFRSMQANVARAFMRVERGVMCAQTQTDLRRVLHVFADFCAQNPLKLRTRSFIPWRQVKADLCREKVLLNGDILADHCASTGEGIALLERAVRSKVRPFLSDLKLDPCAADAPGDEQCPPWWDSKQVRITKAVRRPSVRVRKKEDDVSPVSEDDDIILAPLADRVARRVALWVLQALDRTGAADAWQVLYDTLNPQSPRILLPPSHDVENLPVRVDVSKNGVKISIFAAYDCWIPGQRPMPGSGSGDKESVHLTVMTEIQEQLHFGDLEKTGAYTGSHSYMGRHSSVSYDARRTKIDLAGACGSGRTLRLELRSSQHGDDGKKSVHTSSSSSSSSKTPATSIAGTLQDIGDTIGDSVGEMFQSLGSNFIGSALSSNLTDIVRVGTGGGGAMTAISAATVKDEALNVGVPLFHRSSKSLERSSVVSKMPAFLIGATVLECTEKECASSAKCLVKFFMPDRSNVFLLIAHPKAGSAHCPDWLSDRFFLRDERIHLVSPIGASESIEIWQSESEVDAESEFVVPGLCGFGGPVVVAIKPVVPSTPIELGEGFGSSVDEYVASPPPGI